MCSIFSVAIFAFMNEVGIVSCFTAQRCIISYARNVQRYIEINHTGGIYEVEWQHYFNKKAMLC